MCIRDSIKSFLWGGYHWRSTDRVAPHNAYTSTEKLWEQAIDKGWGTDGLNIASWKFKNDKDVSERPATAEINLSFAGSAGSYGVRWTYDKDSNMYRRENNSVTSIDKVTGLQLEAKTIIVQKVDKSYPSPKDSSNRIILDFMGEGSAIIFMDGSAIDANWSKSSRMSRTRFYDLDGNEIEMNRGKIWVEVVPMSKGKLEGSLTYN